MNHCQYCNTTKQVEETTLSGPKGEVIVHMCESCFSQRVMFDEDVSYTSDGQAVAGDA